MHQTDVYQTAEAYFETLWTQAKNALESGSITPALMQNGQTVPPDYSLTTIARAAVQPNAPLDDIGKIISQLCGELGDQFVYPRESFHISLLGCTQRLPYTADFEPSRIERIRRCCLQALNKTGEIRFHLKGIGLVRNQLFLQVFPIDDTWARLRQQLEDALLAVGETPFSYPNKLPIHMNIMRLTEINPDTLPKTLNILDSLRTVDIGLFTVRYIEYAITDFVVSDTTVLEKIDLA